jgi:glycosyltransferase involved in cell wall biosynthesis
MKVSVLILTKDEELNIAQCISSAKQVSNDIVVLDSNSTDSTTKLARKHGARIISRKFDGWANHQNWAIKNIDFNNKWVLYIDADERIPEELAREILKIDPKNNTVAYKIYRDNRFLNGEKLRFSMSCPGILRLFQPNFVRYERQINPVCIANGQTGKLKTKLVHYNFSKGLEEWVLKHLDYARREAYEIKLKKPNVKILKRLAYYLPKHRFFFRFIYQLIFKLGILDGYAGIRYTILISFYEHLIEEFKHDQ